MTFIKGDVIYSQVHNVSLFLTSFAHDFVRVYVGYHIN